MTKSIQSRGVTFDAKKATETLKGIKSASANLAIFLEAAGKQAAFYGNFDWLNRLFAACPENNNPMMKGNGDMTVKGKAAKAYLSFHFPAVKLEKNDDGIFKASWTRSDKYRQQLCTAIDTDGAKILSDDIALDCAFTFQSWENKGKKQPEPKGESVKSLNNKIDKWLSAMRGEDDTLPLSGNIEEYNILATLADKLAQAAQYQRDCLIASSNGDQSRDAQIDRALVEQDAKRPPSQREKRAGGVTA